MRSPATAFAWEFRQRHRWGLIALAGYLIVLATIKVVIIALGMPIHLDSPESFAFVVVVPVTSTFTYFLAVFTFGLDGDLAARQSMYPARRLTLPVTTSALAGWPMLYGTAAMMLLWFATRLFALWPSDLEMPAVWPGLLIASLLAWAQALTWMPYPLPGLRIAATVILLMSIDTMVILALYLKASETTMVALLAPQIPLAYLVARIAVARARRGDVPDWSAALAGLVPIGVLSRRGRPFSSPARAQAWLEWRQHGRSLPAWIAMLLPCELLLLWTAGTSATLVIFILLGVLITPPFMATFAAASVSSANSGNDSYGIPPFIATRPLTNTELIAAKLKMTIWSTMVTWLIVFIAIPIALELSGTSAVVIERWRRLSDVVGMPRAAVFVLLVVLACVTSTWKQLVQSLYIGLTGRAWLIKGTVFLSLVLLFLIGPVLQWIIDTERLGELWSALPIIFALLVSLKMTAAAWVATRLFRRRLLSDRMLVSGAAAWCVAVLALHGVLAWMFDTPHIPRYLLLLLAILAISLTRLSAAPLALAWNRHR